MSEQGGYDQYREYAERAKRKAEQAEAKHKMNGANGTHPPETQEQPLSPIPWVWRDPTTIPPRPWLLGTTLMLGGITILASPGGTGKTAISIAMALAVLTGRRDILGQHVFKTGNVWILTLEDDRDEIDRRIAAAMMVHNIRPEEIEGGLFINSSRERPVLFAEADPYGKFIVRADAEQFEAGIRAMDIALAIPDPLVKAHRVVENDNGHMDQFINLAGDIANRTQCAILFPHHCRKSTGGEIQGVDAIRGGGALVNGARINRMLSQMAKEEADLFKVPPSDVFRYVRIDDVKGNLAPKEKALWVRLESVNIGNTDIDPAYPNGDNVHAATAWTPPKPFDGLDHEILNSILDDIDAGLRDGRRYSNASAASEELQVWRVVIRHAPDKGDSQAKEIIKSWIKSKLLIFDDYHDPIERKTRRGLRVDQSKRPSATYGNAPLGEFQ